MLERISEIETRPRPDVVVFEPEACLQLIDDVIKGVYFPYRGGDGKTERAIIPAEPRAPHRENNAEHSFQLATTANQLWQQRDRLGIIFPENYDPYQAVSYILDHDIIESV